MWVCFDPPLWNPHHSAIHAAPHLIDRISLETEPALEEFAGFFVEIVMAAGLDNYTISRPVSVRWIATYGLCRIRQYTEAHDPASLLPIWASRVVVRRYQSSRVSSNLCLGAAF